jgi:hypothetical protein
MTDQRRVPGRPGGVAPDEGWEPGRDERGQARIGPVPITATGVLIALALVGSLAYLAYAITVRDASQIPLLASGAVVLGIVFAAIAVVGARAAWRSSVDGRDARAFAHAIVGGLAALAAAACFAGAIILFLLRQTPAT